VTKLFYQKPKCNLITSCSSSVRAKLSTIGGKAMALLEVFVQQLLEDEPMLYWKVVLKLLWMLYKQLMI
jgi:hypothetical protein